MKFTKRGAPASEGNGASNYLKVDEGKSVEGVLRGEVLEFYQLWPQGGQKQIFDKPTAGASLRFKVNFVTAEGGKAVAKVWEFGVTVNDFLAVLSQNMKLETTKIQINRKGSGKNTQWIIIPLGPVDAKGLKVIEQCPLNILSAGAPQASDEAPKEELPF